MGGMMGMLLFGSWAFADKRAVIDMPVSLAVGTIRTPEFPVKHDSYLILIRAEKSLPFADMNCMMGLTSGPLSRYNCNKEPLIQASWTVWDEERVVAQGSIQDKAGAGAWRNDALDRYLGTFNGQAKKKYVLEVKFTKDGTPLGVTNPHLIVLLTKPTDF
jgi:hypothetical protein